MAVKRPSGREPEPDPKVDLSDDMIRRSLAINPGLRSGMSTHEYLAKLKGELVERERGPAGQKPTASGVSQAGPMPDLTTQTLALFFEKKSREFENDQLILKAKEEELKKQQLALKQNTVEHLVDFIKVLFSEARTAPTVEMLRPYRSLLLQLGVTEADVIRQSASRR